MIYQSPKILFICVMQIFLLILFSQSGIARDQTWGEYKNWSIYWEGGPIKSCTASTVINNNTEIFITIYKHENKRRNGTLQIGVFGQIYSAAEDNKSYKGTILFDKKRKWNVTFSGSKRFRNGYLLTIKNSEFMHDLKKFNTMNFKAGKLLNISISLAGSSHLLKQLKKCNDASGRRSGISANDVKNLVPTRSVVDGYEILPKLRLAGGSHFELDVNAKKNVMVVGSRDGTARLIDLRTNALLKVFAGHAKQGGITAIKINDSGSIVATGSGDKNINLWEIATGQLLKTFVGHTCGIQSLDFVEGETMLISSACGASIKIWNVKKGVEISNVDFGKNSSSTSVDYQNGRVALGTSDGKLLIADLKSGKIIHQIDAHSKGVVSVKIGPNGDRIATGSRDHMVKIWNVKDGKLVHNLGQQRGRVSDLEFSPDGMELIVSVQNSLAIWNVGTGRLITELSGNGTSFSESAISSDGRILVTAGVTAEGGGNAKIRVWDAPTKKLISTYVGSTNPVMSIATDENGTLLYAGHRDLDAGVWDLINGRRLFILGGHNNPSNWIRSASLNATGKYLLVASSKFHKGARLWDLRTKSVVKKFAYNDYVTKVAFDTDGGHVFAAVRDGTISRWNIDSGKLVSEFKGLKTKYGVKSIGLSRNGRLLIGYATGTVIAWNKTNGKNVKQFHVNNKILARNDLLAIDPSQKPAAQKSNTDVKKGSNPNAGKNDPSDVYGIYDAWNSAIFKRGEGDNFYYIGKYDKILRKYNPQKLRWKTRANLGQIEGLEVPINSNKVITSSFDGTIKVFSRKDGTELASLMSFDDGEWIVITPQGFFNSSPGGAKHINIIKNLDVISVDQVFDALYRPDLVREALDGDPRGKVKAAAKKLDIKKIVASGLPPNIKISSVFNRKISEKNNSNFTTEKGSVSISAEIKVKGGGIGRIEWRVNGITQIGVNDISLKIMKNMANETTEKVKQNTIFQINKIFKLVPGINTITGIAYNSKNLVSSLPIVIQINSNKAKISDPKLHILVVGVDEYEDHSLKLNYSVSDANSIVSALKVGAKNLYSEIVVHTLLDKSVTLEGLIDVFSTMSDQVRTEDTFVFFLAGHGKTEDGRFYFIPQNFEFKNDNSVVVDGISQVQWQQLFSIIPAQKSLLLYDTCESGSMTIDKSFRSLQGRTAIGRFGRATGRIVLSAASDTEPALEGYNNHGVFTYAVLNALVDGDYNNDNQIDVSEIASHIEKVIPQISKSTFGYEQVPQKFIQGSPFPISIPVPSEVMSEIE